MGVSDIKAFLKELISIVLIAFVLSMVLRFFVVEGRLIPSGSMLPTIQENDRVMINKMIYHFKDPQRGDIVVLDPPAALQETELFIKRVVGLPGETVEVRNGKVYINGEPLQEPYTNGPFDYQYGPVVVPEDGLFVMGDNRGNSFDSHLWNAWLTIDRLKGKAMMIYWPFNHFHLLERKVEFE
ncbi:MAG: signal peptidase I [Syntrophomonadaceae bacterium]|jgi:signal peptidase I|nr:signal peptidase I [Syntrophomonadaceae bacterium]